MLQRVLLVEMKVFVLLEKMIFSPVTRDVTPIKLDLLLRVVSGVHHAARAGRCDVHVRHSLDPFFVLQSALSLLRVSDHVSFKTLDDIIPFENGSGLLLLRVSFEGSN